MLKTASQAMQKRLSKERNIWIATVRADGRPHMVPVWFVWLEEKLYVCIEPKSVKGRNLVSNKSVSLALEDGTRPIICEGDARFVPKPWPQAVADIFQEKYGWEISSELQYTQLVEVTARKWLRW
ncbi:MAG: pyridoxamine 5'-phosphate oxidase family protein [Nitrososphaera sp.]